MRKKNPVVKPQVDPVEEKGTNFLLLMEVAGKAILDAIEASLQTVLNDFLLSHKKCQGDL